MKIKEAVDEMYSQIKEDPTKKIPSVYQEATTAKINENLDYDERCALLQEWPTFRAVQSRLYQKKFVPSAQGDILLENGKRIIMFSTNALLDILARDIEILGDGTFKITPKLWLSESQQRTQLLATLQCTVLRAEKRTSSEPLYLFMFYFSDTEFKNAHYQSSSSN